jgi:hypothetical protein
VYKKNCVLFHLKKPNELICKPTIKKKDYEKKKDTEEFLALLIDNFPTSVNKAALEAQEENRRRKKNRTSFNG